MYLLVFATLAIAILSTYTQVLAVNIARITAAQTGIGQAMLSWHAASMSMANSVLATNAPATSVLLAGCSLANDKSNQTMVACPSPKNLTTGVATNGTSPGTITGTISQPPYPVNLIYNKTLSVNECVHLPSTICGNPGSSCTSCTTTFNAKDYEFYSVMFQDSVTHNNYVITYAAPATDSSYLTLASSRQISLTTNDLLKQLYNLKVSPISVGTVNGHTLISGPATYNVPSSIPNGAVAIIGYPTGS